MKKVKRRAYSAMLIAGLLIVGTVIYLMRLVNDGEDWATFRANQSVYHNGVLNVGTIYDRNGKVLAHAGNGTYGYAEDWATRISSLHTVGDYPGHFGSGALSVFSPKLVNYSLLNGTYTHDGTGGSVTLSIDASLNAVAYGALAGRNGAVVVYNYETGEIICMVSAASFDPNGAPPDGVEGIYINRAIGSTYTPGSVFKIITLAAAIENISDLSTRSFYCSGSVVVGGRTVTCTGVHGSQTIEQAFANSCNCAFSEISVELGADTLYKYAENYGLLSSHDLDGMTTAAGEFEKAESGSNDLAWSGIGQYNNLVSPYAMMRLMGAIANNGDLYEPTILIESNGILGSSPSTTRLMKPATAKWIKEIMSYAVVNSYGTWRFPDLDLCAKTGTAEVGSGASHSWFTGFLKSGEPLAFAVIVEHGGSGLSAAGAIANTILQEAIK